MGILASPTLTGLTPGALPSGFVQIVGTFGGNAAETGITSISGNDSDTLLYTGISAQAPVSLFIQQVITYVSASGVPSLLTPIFRANSSGTTGYVWGIPAINKLQLFTANFVTASFTAIGSPGVIAYTPKVGDTANLLVLAEGTGINVYFWNNLYGMPSLPSISLTNGAISAAGYSGLFAAYVNSNPAQAPLVTKFIVGQSIFYGAPTFITGNSNGVTISIPSPSSGGTAPYTYSVLTSRVPGSPPSGQSPISGLSGTFSSASASAQTATVPIVSGDMQYIRVNYTDSYTTPESILGNEIPVQPYALASYLFIGDSLTEGYESTGNNDPVTLIKPFLISNSSPSSVTVTNEGQGGSATGDWLPGATSGYLASAITQANSQSCTDIHIMLGTNDAHLTVTASQYNANMLSIINYLFAKVPTLQRIMLANAPYISPNGAGGVYGEWCNQFLRQYAQQNLSIVNGSNILPGADCYEPFAQFNLTSFSTIYNSDGIHLTNLGYGYLAQIWYSGYANLLNNNTSPIPAFLNRNTPPLRPI
jgi:lysophospholipase L1-like esterase